MYLTRSEFWTRFLGSLVSLMLFTFIFVSIHEYFIIPVFIITIVLMVLSLIWTVQRLHDVGLSGWWYFIGFIPIIGEVILFIILLLPSDTFDQYGGSDTEYESEYE